MEIRNARRDDLDALKAFSDVYNRPNSSTFQDDFFAWQYETSAILTGAEDNGILIALDGEKIIGMSVASKAPVYVNGETTSGIWHQEWYSDIDYRGAGLSLVLAQMKKNDFIGCGGRSFHSVNVFNRVRPTVWFEIERLFVILNEEQSFDLLFAKSEEAKRFLSLQSIATPAPEVRAEPVSRFGGGYDETWNAFRKDILMATDRTSDFMNWRYADHPRFTYERLKVKTLNGDAYFVWRYEPIQDKDSVVARICEAIGPRSAVVEGFPHLFEALQKAKVAFADFFCSHAATNAALIEAGMRPVVTTGDFDLPRLFQPLAEDPRKTLNFGYTFSDETRPADFYDYHRTYITKGDSNQDRPNP